MTYLMQYAKRRRLARTARVDERTLLNRPGFYGDAAVRVFVEDTSRMPWLRTPPEPRVRLRVSDCSNEIALEFSLESEAERVNALFKIDTLLGSLQRFRDALDAEIELYAHREQHGHRRH
jgi:hypothetical protein